MNYKIINDLEQLQRFVDWLPDLKENEIFYGCLFARKKYCKELVNSSDKTQLKRFTFRKNNLIEKIKQLECEIGSYKLKGREVPQEALVLYVNPNPRDQKAACYAGVSEIMALLKNQSVGYNLHQEIMNCVQRSKGTTHYVDFDFDLESKDEIPTIIEKVRAIVGDNATFVETYGGLHVLIRPQGLKHIPKWYPQILEVGTVDQIGDQLLPVVGTTQGNFIPKFL